MNGQRSFTPASCFRSRFIALLIAAAGLAFPQAAFAQCIDNSDCSNTQYCAKSVGDCDGFGTCAARPVVCTDEWDPVCGCDGATYFNPCEAAAAGVSILHEGECQPCRNNNDCDDTHYCAKDIGDCDGEGLCLERPLGCTDEWDPVCGCDNQTYGNPCEAAAAGVSILHLGKCADCFSNDDCDAENDYCAKDIGDCNGPGECMPRPTICTEEYDPVCGCDGNTYGNSCEAAAAGVSILHKGECICMSNEECEDTHYCAKAVGDCDGYGTCLPRPVICTDEWDPVCGCDGKTYSNDCDAAAAGVNILHEGECQPCRNNNDCEETHYCAKAVGDCNGEGLCLERPLGCPDVWDPVCGCDGKTYSNDCDAAAAGVSIKHIGECENGLTLGSTLTSDNIIRIVKRWQDEVSFDAPGSIPARRPDLSDLLQSLARLRQSG